MNKEFLEEPEDPVEFDENRDKTLGCGAGITQKVMELFTDREKNTFLEACKAHDRRYTMYHGESEETRKIIDRRFLDDMLELSGGSYWYRFKARLYYRAVRMFGGKFFKSKKS